MTDSAPGAATSAVGAISALLERFPGDGDGPVAAMDLAHDPGGLLMISVKPRNPDAAPVVVKAMADGSFQVRIAHSRLDVVTDTAGPRPVDLLTGILEAVFAGRITEAPGRKGGTLKIELYDRTTIKVGEVVGAAVGSRDWNQFAAYGDAPTPEPPPPKPGRLKQIAQFFRTSPQ